MTTVGLTVSTVSVLLPTKVLPFISSTVLLTDTTRSAVLPSVAATSKVADNLSAASAMLLATSWPPAIVRSPAASDCTASLNVNV